MEDVKSNPKLLDDLLPPESPERLKTFSKPGAQAQSNMCATAADGRSDIDKNLSQ